MTDKRDTSNENDTSRRTKEQRGKRSVTPTPASSKAALPHLLEGTQVPQTDPDLRNQELRQANRQLEEMLARRSDLYDFTPVGLMVVARPGTIMEINLTGATLLGIDRAKLVKRDLRSLIAPESRPAFDACLEQVFADGAMVSCEVRLHYAGLPRTAALHAAGQPDLVVQIEARESIHGDICLMALVDITARKRAEAALQESEAKYRRLFEDAAIGVFHSTPDGRFIEVNAAFARMLGYESPQAVIEGITNIAEQLYADPRQYRTNVTKVQSRETPFIIENRYRRKDGTIWYGNLIVRTIRDTHGHPRYLEGFVEDITVRKQAEEGLERLNRTLRVVSACNHALVHAENEVELMEHVCRVVVDLGGFRMAWVGRAEQDADQMVRPVAVAGHDAGYLESVKISWGDNALGQGPTGTAIRTSRPVVNADFATSPLVSPWREAAQQRGYASSISLPIHIEGVPMGALSIYADQPGAFDDQAVALLEELAADLAYGIQALRTAGIAAAGTAALHASEALYRALIETTGTGYVILDVHGSVVDANDEYLRLTGYTRLEEILGRNVTDWTAPYDVERNAREVQQCVAHGFVRNLEIDYVNHDGQATPIEINATVVGHGDSCSILTLCRDITERKRAEKAIREQAQRYQNMLGKQPYGILVVNSESRTEFANHTFCDFLGLRDTPESLVGLTSHQVITRIQSAYAEPDRVIAMIKEVVARAEPFTNYEILMRDGRVLLMDFQPLVVDGIYAGRMWIHHDITERKRSEEALRRSESELLATLDSTADGILAVDTEGKVIHANRRFAELWRVPQALVESGDDRALLDFVLDQLSDPQAFLDKVQALYGSDTIDLDTLAFKDGRIYERASYPMLIGETVAGRVWSFSDITERKRAEEELRESEERFRELVTKSPQAILVVQESKMLYTNPAAQAMLGYTNKELLKLSAASLIAPESQPLVSERWRRVQAGRSNPLQEVVYRRKDGARVITASVSVPVSYERTPACMVILQDITERKQAEDERDRLQAQLVQAVKMESVGRLAGGVAHDFNNMLVVILGNVELTMARLDPREPLYADLQEIKTAAQRSADLTRQLLTFARKQTIAPKVLDLNETISGTLQMLRRLIGEDVNLAWMPGANLGPVHIDPAQVNQLLTNLCINARAAIDDVGDVTIETRQMTVDADYCADHPEAKPGEYVLLTVSDNGCGVEKDMLPHLFEPFFTTKNIGEGTGLGLATVYGIVKQNGGFINVYSEPRQGTTFNIYLPRYRGERLEVRSERSRPPMVHGGETILLVEDEPTILSLCKRMLEQQGYQVLIAETPGEAIRQAEARAGDIDLLITDVVMPEMNGRELAKHLLALYPEMKRLFMSGYTANVIAHHGILEEGVNFLQKPFTQQDLVAKVRAILDE